MMNVYQMHGEQPRTTHHAFYFLDLPGYGYARAGKAERVAFRRLVEGTLHRPLLAGALWLLDIRRDPSPDDRTMHELFAAHATRVLAALTKSDKLSRAERPKREGELLATLALDREQVIATSAQAHEGIDELRVAIMELIRTSEFPG